MNLIAAFVKSPVKVSVGALLVVLFGLVALRTIPLQLTPEVLTPTLTIETRWPGASPQEVEREIVQEQEEQLKGVEGLRKMTSECLDSVGRIILEFTIDTNMNEALLLVNSRLQQVQEYPEDAREPTISTSNSSDRPVAWLVVSAMPPDRAQIRTFIAENPRHAEALERVIRTENDGLALLRLRTLVREFPELEPLLPPRVEVEKARRFVEDHVEAALERVPGVANSNVFGGREEELQVVVDPQRLASRGVTISQLRQALQSRSRDTSAGDFWEGKRRWVVRTLARFDDPEDVRNWIVTKRDGRPVYVRDVADVELGYKKPTGVVRRFGEEVIAVNCVRSSGANVLDVMAGIREVTRELNDGILRERNMRLTQVYDETDYIYSSLGLVRQNILVGGLLTVVALLLFLRSPRSTLVIAVAIPTSLIGTFLVMRLLGRSLNVVSLAGLAFAVGMLVDNAVVVLENIFRHYQSGRKPFEAAVKGAQEVWGAVIASTLTTLAVFIPVLFVREEAGQLFRDIAIAISSAVTLSLIISVTLIPTFSARILKRRTASSDKPAALPPIPPDLPRRTRLLRLLVRTLRHPALSLIGGLLGFHARVQRRFAAQILIVLLLVSGSLGASYLLFPKVEYLPTGNRNLVFGILLPPPGYNLETLQSIGESIEQQLRPYWDVDLDAAGAASSAAPVISDFFYVTANRQVFLGVRSLDPLRAHELVGVVQQIAAQGPHNMFAIAKQSSLFEQGITEGRTIDVEISGPELTRLMALGGQVMGQVMGSLPDAFAFPRPSLDLSSPEVHVIPKWEKAADMQVHALDFGYAVNALVDGAYATDYYLDGERIDLTIKGQEDFASRTQDLLDLPVMTPSGSLVPLGALADVRISGGPEQINRRERQRAVTIQVSPSVKMPLEDAMDRIENDILQPLIATGQLGGGYRVNLSGTADKLVATWNALQFNFLLALLITYLLMAALFESWLYPFVIILSVPFGAVGGLIGLSLVNTLLLEPRGLYQPLDVLTMLGFVILIGTVVNNAILIVHQALNNMRDASMPVAPAILESVRTRIRPIFMTTTTTVLGLAPLVIFPGAGSELYRGLGSVVLGGLIVSTLFTLILIPTLFHLMLSLKLALVRMIYGDKEVAEAA